MSTFILGGKTAKELGMIMLRTSQRPVLPGTRNYVEAIPLMAGAYDYGADLEPRLFSLECAFVTKNPLELQTLISDLAAYMLDANGRPRTMDLTFSLQPDRTFQVRYAGQMPIDRVVGLGRFTLPLIAYDPFSYTPADAFDEAPGDYDTGLQYDSGLMYENPLAFTWEYTYQMCGQYNYSKLNTPLIVTISGDVVNPSITNQNTGQTLSISTTLSGQTLVLDSKRMTAVVDGVSEMRYASGEFPELIEGNNGLIFQCSSTPNATVTFGWKHKFA